MKTRSTARTPFASGTVAAVAALSALGALGALGVAVPMPAAASTAVVWDNGTTTGSPDAYAPRPALSLSKLYLGYWVLHHGAPEDKAKVEQMIRYSDDGIAFQLDRRYPNAIDDVARQFDLPATNRRGHWGNATTSANDVARFVQAIRFDPVAEPIMRGMRDAAPIAADGFHQDYGTSRLPGAQGTKFGWSDDRRSATGTVSFGDRWSASALTYGDARANTNEALRDIRLDPPGPAPSRFPGGGPSGPSAPTIQLGPWSLPAVYVRDLLAPFLPPQVLGLIPAGLLVPVGSSSK